jgi:hypothetical protein
MALKELLVGQNIEIDDHKRGAREIKEWDDVSVDVHIHKTTNYKIDGREREVVIKVPLNSGRGITVTIGGSNSEEHIPNKLRKEIKQAFSNKRTREGFMFDLVKIIRNFKSVLSTEEKANRSLNNLSKHFGLNWTGELITDYVAGTMKKYSEIYVDEANKEFYISVGENSVKLGELDERAKRKIGYKNRRRK